LLRPRRIRRGELMLERGLRADRPHACGGAHDAHGSPEDRDGADEDERFLIWTQ